MNSQEPQVPPKPGTFAHHLQASAHPLSLLTKAVRSRRLYPPQSRVYLRTMHELSSAFETYLADKGKLTLQVRIDGLYLKHERVLSPEPECDGLVSALYQDGVRQLSFYSGIQAWELNTLVEAGALPQRHALLGEDIVSYLWRHSLEHIQYLLAEPSGTSETRGSSQQSLPDLDKTIDTLLNEIYNSDTIDESAPTHIRHRSSLSAKLIAENLCSIDEMAPGFQPLPSPNRSPIYSEALVQELKDETFLQILARTMSALLACIENEKKSESRQELFSALLNVYDEALQNGQLLFVSQIINSVRYCPSTPEQLDWLKDATSDARLRLAARHIFTAEVPDIRSLVNYYRTCGPSITHTILSVISEFSHSHQRRMLSELIVELGEVDLNHIQDRLAIEELPTIEEIIYILTHIRNEKTLQLLYAIEHHPSEDIRIIFLENSSSFGDVDAVSLGIRMFSQPESKVKIAAAHHLARMPCRRVVNFFEKQIKNPDFDSEIWETKLALLCGFIKVGPTQALPILEEFINKGLGFFSAARSVDTAIQSIRALRNLKSAPRVNTILTKATHARKRKVRVVAHAILDGVWSPPQ